MATKRNPLYIKYEKIFRQIRKDLSAMYDKNYTTPIMHRHITGLMELINFQFADLKKILKQIEEEEKQKLFEKANKGYTGLSARTTAPKKKNKTLSAGYKRQNEGTRGQYEFLTKDGVYILDSYLVERQNDTEDSLEIQDNLRNVLGTIIIKNSAWPKLKKGLTIMARSSKGPKGKLTKIKNYN
jgi:hypothetical protein